MEDARTSKRRTYDDGCAAAHALDSVGERWMLLVVRELLRRANELCATREDPLSARIAGLSAPALRREVEEARTRAARGKVKPLEF